MTLKNHRQRIAFQRPRPEDDERKLDAKDIVPIHRHNDEEPTDQTMMKIRLNLENLEI
jgi:L-ascorbate metabolism protein UlaG (beta-lactamase superfamily)